MTEMSDDEVTKLLDLLDLLDYGQENSEMRWNGRLTILTHGGTELVSLNHDTKDRIVLPSKNALFLIS